MDIAYVAQTESCALMLDAGGFCRSVLPNPGASEKLVASARRCLNAQFVASLDREVEGLLSPEPRVGASLLFTSINPADGRTTLVRFGPLTSFESLEQSPPTVREHDKSTKDLVALENDSDADVEELTLEDSDSDDDDVHTSASAEPMPDLRDDDSSADVTDLYRKADGSEIGDDDDLLDDESAPLAVAAHPPRRLPFPADADSELDINTGSFMRVSTPVLSEISDLLQEDGRIARASGFVIRQAPLVRPPEELIDDEDTEDPSFSRKSSLAALQALEALEALNGRETKKALESSPVPSSFRMRPSEENILRAVASIVDEAVSSNDAQSEFEETRRFVRPSTSDLLPLTKRQMLPPPMPREARPRPLLRKVR